MVPDTPSRPLLDTGPASFVPSPLAACGSLSPRRAAFAGACWIATMAVGVASFLPGMLSGYFGLARLASPLVSLAIVLVLHVAYISAYAAWVAWFARRRAADPLLVAAGLQRFDHQVVLHQEREIGEALRRHVPQAVAARLTRGQAIEGGEREVSVLFVEIRGYTSLSEQRDAGMLFSVINVYSEAIAAVIQKRGGTVVEFLGDGVMALFGAPDPCPDHAVAAVRAAREVVAAVRDLELDTGEDVSITVGVGIASGRAFVGNIQTNERLVCTAVGDVVNLASRIQGLTRDLDAAVAIDSRTHSSAGRSAARFRRHPRIPIRGRTEPVDVYTLPLSAH